MHKYTNELIYFIYHVQKNEPSQFEKLKNRKLEQEIPKTDFGHEIVCMNVFFQKEKNRC